MLLNVNEVSSYEILNLFPSGDQLCKPYNPESNEYSFKGIEAMEQSRIEDWFKVSNCGEI